jgi:hypothetical protein
MVKGPPLLRTTAAVTAFDETGPGMMPPLKSFIQRASADITITFRKVARPRNIPLTPPRPSKNSIHICRKPGAAPEKREDNLPRWTKSEAASMAIVDPVFADKFARSQ